MSVLADLYVACADNADKYDSNPEQFADRVQHTSLPPLEFSTLWATLRGAALDVSDMDAFLCVLERDAGARLVHIFPSEMVTVLGALFPQQFVEVSSTWAATEELGCSKADVEPVLIDLVQLARRASESAQDIYL